MADERSDRSRRKQKTRPRKGEPVEIPVPSKADVFRDLTKIAKPEKRAESDDEGRETH